MPAGAFEAFREDLGLSYRTASAVLTLMAIGGIAGSVFTVLADSRSRRAIATVGAFGYAASIAAFAAGHSLWVLAIGSIGIGLFSTALVDATEIAAVDLAGDELEPLLARINVGATAGDFIGPALLASVALLGGSWRTALLLSAAGMALFGCVVAAAPLPPPHPHHAQGHAPLRETLAMLRSARVWWAGALGAGLVALDESFLAYVIASFENERGSSRGASVLLGAAMVLGAASASLLLSRKVARRATPVRLRVAAAVLTVTAVAIAVAPTVWAPAMAAFGFGAATIAFWLPLQAFTLRLHPGRAGTTKAVLGAIEMFGLLIPIGIGALSDRAGLDAGLLLYATVPALMLALTMLYDDPAHAKRARAM